LKEFEKEVDKLELKRSVNKKPRKKKAPAETTQKRKRAEKQDSALSGGSQMPKKPLTAYLYF